MFIKLAKFLVVTIAQIVLMFTAVLMVTVVTVGLVVSDYLKKLIDKCEG